jgi:hypothetical protein
VALVAGEIALDASYGVTPWLAAELRFPLRIVSTRPTYNEIDGTPKLVPNDIHHHDETLAGPADPWLVVRVAAARGALTTSARFGLSLPIGMTQPNPYALAAEGRWHEHVQFGSGTVMPIVGLGLSFAAGPTVLAASGQAIFSFYDDRYGYRAPSSFFLSARATLPLLGGALKPYAAVELPYQTDELWSGAIGAEGPTARAELLLGGGLSWEFYAPWSVELGFRARAAKLTEAATFDYPGVLQIAIATHAETAAKRPRR